MDLPMMLAGVGIGVTILLLAFLSIYQQARAKKLKAEKIATLRAAKPETKVTPAGKTPFFVACYRGNNPRFFRVYRTPGELLFVFVGSYSALIDAESPRGSDDRHWLLRSFRMLAATLSGGTIAALLVLGGIVLLCSRAEHEGLLNVANVTLLMLGVGGIAALVVAITVPTALWQMTRRGTELDALPLSGLVEQAAADEKSFRASRSNVAELKIVTLDPEKIWCRPNEACIAITFKHAPSGRWKIETLTTQDSRDAVRSLLTIWGRDRIQIDESLVRRLETFDDWSARQPSPAVAFAGDASAPLRTEADAAPEPPQVYEPKREEVVRRPRPETTAGGTFSMNGCGTMVCDGRGLVEWNSDMPDCDAVLAFCIVGIPLVPYAAVHTHDWHYEKDGPGGFLYRTHPVRWSPDLFFDAYARRLWILGAILGGICFAIGFAGGFVPPFEHPIVEWLSDPDRGWIFVAAGAVVVAVSILVRYAVSWRDRRHQGIRLLMGRHPLGSSDPAYWTTKLLKLIRPPQQSFGTPTFAAAVPTLAKAGDFQRAMFAARLSTAWEDRSAGERLTDAILAEPAAQDMIQRNRRKLGCEAPEPIRQDWDASELFA